MATLHAGGVVYIKGAPEVVLERCAAVDGAVEAVGALAERGMRVLAVAEKRATTLDGADLDGGFRLLASRRWPIRPASPR